MTDDYYHHLTHPIPRPLTQADIDRVPPAHERYARRRPGCAVALLLILALLARGKGRRV